MVEAYSKLITTVDDGVGVIELDDPGRRNALGRVMHEEIIDCLAAWSYDDAVAAVLFVGTEDHFCSGWALDALADARGAELRQVNDLALRLMTGVYDYRKPTIAAVAGVAPGYGMDLANMCDITIASENAVFGSTQVKYAMNGFYHALMRRVGPQRARRMLFTGDPIAAHEALRVGLVDEVVPVGTVRAAALRLAHDIAEHGAELTTTLKRVALRVDEMDHVGATAYELSVTADLIQRETFESVLADGIERMRSGRSRATERLQP